MAELGLKQRPKRLDELQAAAAIGQSKLMAVYDELFGKFGITVAQVLLTHDDLKDRTRHLNAHGTLATLLAHGVVPIINENDTVAVEEIKFGDNDRLGALAATLIDADLLIILSHVEGLLEGQGRVIPAVPEITREIEALAGGTDRTTSVGGMKSKIEAGKIVTRVGIPLVIAYTAAKSAMVGMVKGYATEFSAHGVRVNCIAPGWIETEISRKAFEGDPARKAKVLGRTPAGCLGQPEDIGWAAVYLSSPAATFVTGVTLPVDGGASIGF